MILLTVLTKRTLDSGHSPEEHQDTHTGGQEHHQEQMTGAMNQEWRAEEGGTGTSGQEIIRRGIGDIRRQGNSPGPGVLQEITVKETWTLDSETGIETIKAIR